MNQNTNIDKISNPKPPAGWKKCHAYLKRKVRFCSHPPTKVSPQLDGETPQYCVNHQHLYGSHALQDVDTEKLQDGAPPPTATTMVSWCETTNQMVGPHGKRFRTKGSNLDRSRVPCPVDPSHTVYEDRLQRHILICPKYKRQRQQEEQSFYQNGINTGGHGDISPSRSGSVKDLDWAKRLACRVLFVHQSLFGFERVKRLGSVSSETKFEERHQQIKKEDEAATARVITLSEIRNALPIVDCSRQEIQAGLSEAIQAHRIKSGGPKHLQQQASLIGHVRRLGFIPSLGNYPTIDSKVDSVEQALKPGVELVKVCRRIDDRCRIILDLGAGRGMTGLVLAGVMAGASSVDSPPARLVMVERGSARSKADTILRNARRTEAKAATATALRHVHPQQQEDLQRTYLDLKRLQWNRVVCDLAHIDMKALVQSCSGRGDSHRLDLEVEQREPNINAKPDLLIVAKHLCGVGTDLALKSLETVRGRLLCCIMATCCHGICSWSDYVGRDFLQSVMQSASDNISFGADEFDLMRRWSAGTVNGRREMMSETDLAGDDTRQDIEHQLNSCECERGSSAFPISMVVDSLQLACGAPGLGRACQRLIDYGRREYIRHVLFQLPVGDNQSNAAELDHVQLLHYVSDEVTPQNAALIAVRPW